MLFSDLEADLPRRKHFADREARGGGAPVPGGAPRDDGSFKGGPGARSLGLGFGAMAAPAEGDGDAAGGGGGGSDVFSSYRTLRSRGYHDMIIKSTAGKFS